MSEKKQKALEKELIDDLLEDQTDALRDANSKSKDDITDEADPPSSVAVPEGFSLNAGPKENTIAAEVDEFEEADFSEEKHPPAPPARPGDDPTIRLPEEKPPRVRTRATDMAAEDEVRSSVGRFGAFRNTSNPTGAALAQSENLRIAQNKILELEQEVERLRMENEQLAAAAETFRRKSDELKAKSEDLDNRYKNAVSTHAQEKTLLVENKEQLRHQADQMRVKNEELELRISTNIQKIRVRERELENRLELVKMEGAALIRSKDELILDLKRQIDQINLELNNYRVKSQELNRMILDKQDILRRTVKALRLALTMLEGEEAAAPPQKKAK